MNKIKDIRKKKNMTQKELAEKAMVSRPYLHDLENNHRGARPETLQRIANVLGVKVVDLVKSDQRAG